MKRSPLQRRTPLGRGKPLAPESAKRRRERPLRAAVRAETLTRADGRCQAAGVAPGACWGPLDCHEVEARGTHPGSHLRVEVTVAVCRGHHEWIGAHPADAEALGLRKRGTR